MRLRRQSKWMLPAFGSPRLKAGTRAVSRFGQARITASPSVGMERMRSKLTWRIITDASQSAPQGPEAHPSRRSVAGGCAPGAGPAEDRDCRFARHIAADAL